MNGPRPPDAALEEAPNKRLPRSHRAQSDPGGDTSVPARKRRLDATESDPLPAKRARLTNTQQPRAKDEKAEQGDKRNLQQPQPKHPYAALLKDFVDPIHPGPGPVSLYAFVSDWLESVGSDREKQCRSDRHLRHSDDVPVSRNLARSAPDMGYTRDADGYAVPPTPTSTRSRRSYQATEDSVSSTAGVRHPSYRRNNLASNGIYIRHADTQLPDHISSHVEGLRAERDSPGPSSQQIDGYLHGLEILAEGCNEADVEGLLEDAVFPKPLDLTYGRRAGLESARSSLMSSYLIPNNSESPFRVSGPKPDRLYGYSGALTDGAFTQPQFLAQTGLHPRNARFAEATTQGLRFPFFAIEFKAAGGTRGDLWVATNQCAGASSACLNAVHQLNTSLPKHPSVQCVDNLSYSIAVDNNTAQLYISWKEDDLNYYLQRVGAFLLSDPDHFKNFRKQVRNILDWGKDTHLKQIRDALDTILEENRKKAEEHAKSRQTPSESSAIPKKRKSSSSRGNSSRSNSVQEQHGETNEPYWDQDDRPQQDTYEGLSFPPDSGSYIPSQVGLADYVDEQQDEGLAPAEPDDQQDDEEFAQRREEPASQTDLLVSFESSAESTADPAADPASFAWDSLTEVQPAAATDNSWRWSRKHQKYYYFNEDGSRTYE